MASPLVQPKPVELICLGSGAVKLVVKTDDGAQDMPSHTLDCPLCESAVIADYIEAAYPAPALVPAQAFAAAKVRELITFMELHLELVARNLYPQAFFGGTVSEAAREKVGIQLEKNIAAFAKLASFAPYVAGDSFSMADCAAIVHLPLVSSATKAIYGRDYLAELPVRDYLARMAERPHVQRINADRKTSTAEMLARRK